MLDHETTATRPDGVVVRVVAATEELLAEGVKVVESTVHPEHIDINIPTGETDGQALEKGDHRIQEAEPKTVEVTPGLTVPGPADQAAAEAKAAK